jgi:hypothetical protein
MKEQKDTEKTSLNSYGQNTFSSVNSLVSKPIYDFTNKKTEKLVTALYMVTDCMDTDDALKEKLRLLGVELLSHNHKLSTLLPAEKHPHIVTSLNYIFEILSFIEVANTIGYVSDMNTAILKKEFNILVGELENHLPREKHFQFSLDEEMFRVPADVPKAESLSLKGMVDISTQSNKRTNYMSFINKTNTNVLYKPTLAIDYKKVKTDRVEKIMSIIKDKSNSTNDGATIKDISIDITDCSEKTIQRELNELIEKGEIKKTGDKRWSRYSVISNK